MRQQQRQRQQQQSSSNDEQLTAGCSGVLFAWMVVDMLEMRNPQSCPVFFLPELCFETFDTFIPGLRWNWSIIVKLGVMQLILPRASASGHLAGVSAGMLIHAELLPICLVQPCILLPLLYSIYLKVRPNSNNHQSTSLMICDNSATTTSWQ